MTGTENLKSNSKTKKELSQWTKILLIILLIILCLAAVASRYLYPTGRIAPETCAVRINRNGVPMGNFFLLQVNEKYIAIDAGADHIQTEKGLQKLGVSPYDVMAVFVTHAHWDHIGSLDLFDKAVIYTGNTEDSEFPDLPHQIMTDGEVIELSGMSVQCIYTPGHTIDSVCYLVDGKHLFVGDLFVTTNDPPPPNSKRYDSDLQLFYREKMLEIEGVQYVFTGHFGLFKDVRFFRLWL